MNEICRLVYDAAASQTVWDWLVFVTGLLYIYYAARNQTIAWVWGILSSGLFAITTWTQYGLGIDALLQGTYVVMGIWGLIKWWQGDRSEKGEVRPISMMTIVRDLCAGAILSAMLYMLFKDMEGIQSVLTDALTTGYALIATYWLIKRYIATWWLWVVVDAAYVILYINREAWLFALLLLVYTVLAIYGWLLWKQLYDERKKDLYKDSIS